MGKGYAHIQKLRIFACPYPFAPILLLSRTGPKVAPLNAKNDFFDLLFKNQEHINMHSHVLKPSRYSFLCERVNTMERRTCLRETDS